MNVATFLNFGRLAVVVVGLLLLDATDAKAEGSAQRSIGFSNLVFRLDGDDAIGIAEADFRVHILEELRTQGLSAVGAENLVFGKDHGDAAELLLGGTVRELACQEVEYKGGACRLGIEWELLDVRRDAVVYRVLTRSAVYRINLAKPAGVPTRLVLGALRSLIKRPGFRRLLPRTDEPRSDATAYAAAEYRPCSEVHKPMPQGAEAALDATVVVRTDSGFGSGFFLNADGYVITAAHVVADAQTITVKTRVGTSHQAELIRMSRRLDAALLRVKDGGSACFAIEPALPPPGADVYAVGSPASEQLAFSVTRGIVSGARTFDDVPFLQTDASISPGNSGGPLVNQAGKVAAIVSWKVVGGRVDGIAFGVPIAQALQALSLTPGATTSEALKQALVVPRKAAAEPVTDTPDAVPAFDPEFEAQLKRERERREREERIKREQEERDRREREARRAQEEQEKAQAEERERRIDALTPGYVKVMKWGGLGLAGAGTITALAAHFSVDDARTTQDEFETLRLTNDIGWIAAGLGAASFAVSFVLTPKLPDEGAKKAALSLELGPAQVGVSVCY